MLTIELLRRIGVKWFLYTIKFSHTSLKYTTSQKKISSTKKFIYLDHFLLQFQYAIYFLISGASELCHIK